MHSPFLRGCYEKAGKLESVVVPKGVSLSVQTISNVCEQRGKVRAAHTNRLEFSNY